MASVDLQSFIEDRLLSLDPSIDLSPGSPAQTQVVAPVLAYLGTDPFETDIDAFLTDRFAQEFPDIYASDPGVIRDTFVNPLKLILEPFKRETQSIRRAQSLIDPSQLSDDDADALVANIFDTRDPGGYAMGTARVFFQNPTDVRVEVTSRHFSDTGLNFFPTNPVAVSAETMVFNRDGSLFYLDIPIRAENPGDEYNIDAGHLAGVNGLPNVVKVTNLRRFQGGSARQDTTAFLQAAEESLTERSLTTRRGAAARLSNVFQGSVRAVQVIGAKDPEMQRDLLVAAGPGHAWITGQVELYGQVAFVRARTVEGDEAAAPVPGDTLYFYLDKGRYPGVAQAARLVRLQVAEVYVSNRPASGVYQLSYFVRWSDPEGKLDFALSDAAAKSAFFESLPLAFEGGFSKKGTVRVSSLADVGPVDLSVENGGVHVFGRADVYVRPTTQDVSQAVIDGVYDLGKLGATSRNPHFYLERLTLSTQANSNAVSDPTISDFAEAGVGVGDVLAIEEGSDAGLYPIRHLAGDTLYLSQKLAAARSNVRYRVLKRLRIDPFEPRIVRFPFGDVVQNDLQSTIGSKLVTLGQTDLLQYGARAGDTLRILSGPDAGDYTITAFDANLGGQGPVLDRELTATSFDISFEVFTPQQAVERPLVRVRQLLLLDSAKQSTGLTIPPADPVAVVPTGPFTSAKVLGKSQLASGYVLPDLAGIIDGLSNHPAAGGGRYSLGFDQPNGVYVSVNHGPGASLRAELDLRSDSKGKCSFFLATPEFFDNGIGLPPVNPNPGDCLTLKNGPNAGSYLIKAVHSFEYRTGTNDLGKVFFIQIYGTFPVDPLEQVRLFLVAHGGTSGLENLSFPLSFPGFFTTWFESLGGRLNTALVAAGMDAPGASECQAIVESMAACTYEWGLPARGVLRSYFREPTLFEQKTGESDAVTLYDYKLSTGEKVHFRPDPLRYTKQELIPARLTEDADPRDYPRDLIATDSNDPVFHDESRTSLLASGVLPGDVLSVHQERFFYSTALRQTVVSTEAGSQLVEAPAGAGDVFTEDMVGELLFLEEGDDAGGYRISRVVDGRHVMLDRVLQGSTSTVLKSGSGATYGLQGGQNVVHAESGRPFTDADLGNYLTLFGVDYRVMGGFEITEVLDKDSFGNGTSVVVTVQTNFAAYPQEQGVARWTISSSEMAPETKARDPLLPDALTQECVGVVPVRLYESRPTDFPFSAVGLDAAVSTGTVVGAVRNGIAQPFRIYRPNVRRVTSTEMDQNRDGFLCFFDTEVVSLSPSGQSNIGGDSYLVPSGSFSSLGYRHAVEDPSFTYSMKENGFLDLPLAVLPVGSTDSPESMVRVVGVPVQISYERADLVSLVQDFIDSPSDRVLSAGLLARHFLPAYLSLDVAYSGGESEADVAKAIRAYVDQTPVETPVDVSEMLELVTQRGGNPDTPAKVSATIYDWDRRMWVEFSENELGGPDPEDTKVPYNGSPRVTYFVPGQDVSGLTTIPAGERIKLTRR